MTTPLFLSAMNPPRTSKKRRRAKGKKRRKFSAKQRAWMKTFAARFGGGGGGGKKGKKRRRRSTRSRIAATGGSKESKTMKRRKRRKARRNPPVNVFKRRRSSRRGGPGGGGSIVRDMLRGAIQGTMSGGGALVGFAGTSKIPDWVVPEKWLKSNADGTVPMWKRFAAKAAAGLAMYAAVRGVGTMARSGLIRKTAEDVLAGAVVNVGYDALTQLTKGKLLPKTLSGEDDGGGDMGEIVFDEFTQLTDGQGQSGIAGDQYAYAADDGNY